MGYKLFRVIGLVAIEVGELLGHRIELDDTLEQLWIDDDGRVRRHRQRQPVGRRVRHIVRRDVAIAPGPVFDDDVLLPLLAKLVCQLARHQVVAATLISGPSKNHFMY